MQIGKYRFRPRLAPTLGVLLLLPLFIHLGLWQAGKASRQEAARAALDMRMAEAPIRLDGGSLDGQDMQYRRVTVRGHFETQHQILLDNRLHESRPGYHVLTPLRIEGGEMRILVNRGWIPLTRDRRVLPVFDTPSETVEVIGHAVIPSAKYFELAAPPEGWETVWQNLDLERYRSLVPFAILPIVLRMDETSPDGGFARQWPPPDDKVAMHRGYAIQWFGMAIVLVLFYLWNSLRRGSDAPPAVTDPNDGADDR